MKRIGLMMEGVTRAAKRFGIGITRGLGWWVCLFVSLAALPAGVIAGLNLDGHTDGAKMATVNVKRESLRVIGGSRVAGEFGGGSANVPDLVGYWTFDEGSGDTLVDWSGNQSAGDIVGATWASTGRLGKCLYFDGINDTVVVADGAWNNAAPPYTIMVWYKSAGGGRVLDHELTGATPGAWALTSSGGMAFGGYDTKGSNCPVTMAGTVPTNVWVQAVVTFTTTNIMLYRDGKLMNSASCTNGFPRLNGRLHFGSMVGVMSFFRGWIDEVAIFKRTLSGAEIGTIYANYQNGVGLTPYTNVAVGSVRLAKVLYNKGETGVVSLAVKNFATQSQSFVLTLSSRSWLAQDRTLATRTSTLAAGAIILTNVPFALSATQEQFGCEITASVGGQGMSETVSVSSNFWEVGVYGCLNPSTWGALSPSLIVSGMRTIRDSYANFFEFFFWAPDEWGNLAPTLTWWNSGQNAYPMSNACISLMIDEGHKYGIKAVTYGKHVASGPDGFDLSRRRPELFVRTRSGAPYCRFYDMWTMDNWNNVALRDSGWKPSGWDYVTPDFRIVAALDYGINAIHDSILRYGWDGIRYDGHYGCGNVALSAWNMRHLKQTIWTNHPDFRFGFNYSYSPEGQVGGMTHEIREGMAGGGMYLQEAINGFGYTPGKSYTSWTFFATNELAVAKQVQAVGGQYYCVWILGNNAKSVYTLVYGLIAGGHPYVYGTQNNVPGCANWSKFMTRWSALLWHPGLKQVTNATAQVIVTAPSSLHWAPLMQEVVASSDRKFKVVHLVNPPPTDTILTTTNLPPPVTNITVALTAEPGTTVRRVRLIRPEVQPYDITPPTNTVGHVTTAQVSQITCWGMVVFELSGSFTVPTNLPKFTEQPDPALVAEGRAGNAQTSVDPMDPEPAATNLTLAPNELMWETDHGYNNVPAQGTMDPSANNGVAQVRERGVSAIACGRSWMGIDPGRYRLKYRVKVEDDGAPVDDQKMEIALVNAMGKAAIGSAWYYTNTNGVPANRMLIPDGQYHYYDLGIEWTNTWRQLVTLNGYFKSGTNADNRILMDHLIFTQLEKFTDPQLAAWNPVNKPGGLRVPNGNRPKNVLLVRGLFWQKYNVEGALTCTSRYSLITVTNGDTDAMYREVYTNDAIVLADMGANELSYAGRKILQDYVQDGGRLVILGGPYTLGPGGMMGTYLDGMLPFAMTGAAENVPCGTPLYLRDASGKPYEGKPALLWRHNVTLRGRATIDAYAGTNAIAARMSVSNGLVVAFVGTVQGEPAGVTPFWESASWPTLLPRKRASGRPRAHGARDRGIRSGPHGRNSGSSWPDEWHTGGLGTEPDPGLESGHL